MELALDAKRREGRGMSFDVSILVFVELALDVPISDPGLHVPGTRFNPCFRGTCS